MKQNDIKPLHLCDSKFAIYWIRVMVTKVPMHVCIDLPALILVCTCLVFTYVKSHDLQHASNYSIKGMCLIYIYYNVCEHSANLLSQTKP